MEGPIKWLLSVHMSFCLSTCVHLLIQDFSPEWLNSFFLIFCMMAYRQPYEARHAQSTQNNKFAISLQYLKKHVKNEVDFLSADTHQNTSQNKS